MDKLGIFRLPAPYKYRAAPRSTARLNIREAVSHHVAIAQRYPEILCCLQEQAGAWLSAGTTFAQAFYERVGVVKTIVRRVEVCSGGSERRVKFAIKFVQHGGTEMFFGNPGLIGNDSY
jgi:hypothetical protein